MTSKYKRGVKMKVPCPRCGKETDILIRGLCPKCFTEVYGLIKISPRLRVKICRYCGSIKLGGKWTSTSSFEEAIEKIIKYELSRAKPVEPVEKVYLLGINYISNPNWTTRILLTLEGIYKKYRLTAKKEVEIQLEPSICPTCKIRVSGEYDTLLQIRGGDTKELYKQVENIIWKSGLFAQLVDIIENKKGVDVYFTNMGAARKLSKELKKFYILRVYRVAHENVGIQSSGKPRSRKTLVIRIEKRLEDKGNISRSD